MNDVVLQRHTAYCGYRLLYWISVCMLLYAALPVKGFGEELSLNVREKINLEGAWSFKIDPENSGERDKWYRTPAADWDFLYVPAPWNRQNLELYDTYIGNAWYAKDFYVPKDWSAKAVWLHMEGAMYYAKIWVNGQYLGEHEGGFTHFKFRIDHVLKTGKKNHIAVLVNNTPGADTSPQGDGTWHLHIDWYHWSGLYRPVYLEAADQVHVSDVTIRTHSLHDGQVWVEAEAANYTGDPISGTVTFRINDVSGNTAAEVTGIPFSITQQEEVRLEQILTINDVRQWSPDDPYLYSLEVLLKTQKKHTDLIQTQFGVRTIEARDGKLLLNGREVFLKGANPVEDFPILGRSVPGAVRRLDYALLEDLGANGFRHGAYPPPKADVDLSDKMGMCQFINMPCMGKRGDILGQPETMAKAKLWLREVIQELKNNPSVIIWDFGSEPQSYTEGGVNYIKTLSELAHELDPTRPVSYINNWIVNERAVEAFGDDIAEQYTDVCWAFVGSGSFDWAEKIHRKYNKPVVVEYNAILRDLITPESVRYNYILKENYFDVQLEVFRRQWEYIRNHDFIYGAFWWCYIDYKLHRGIGPDLLSPWGILTRERKPKPVYYEMQKQYKATPTFRNE